MRPSSKLLINFLAAVLCALSLTSKAFADTVGNGGDAIHIGGATLMFDQVEFDEAFLPRNQGEAWRRIDGQLNVLAGKLPNTAAYLRQFFEGGNIMWWFVRATLRNIPDEGVTNVVISFNALEQIAANSNGIVQVRRDLWSQLNDDGKATLLMHEMLWSAVGQGYVGDGAKIRAISRMLLDPNLGEYTPVNIARFMRQFMGGVASPLVEVIGFDEREGNAPSKFRITPVETGLRRDLLITVVAPSAIQGLELTTLRPSTAHAGVTLCLGNCNFQHSPGVHDYVWTDPYYFYDLAPAPVGLSAVYDQDSRRSIAPADLCSSSSYAGRSGWRLPTSTELYELQRLAFLAQIRHVDGSPVLRDPQADVYAIRLVDYAATQISQFDRAKQLAFLTNDGRLACLDQLTQQACIADINRSERVQDIPYLCVRRN